MQPLPEPLRSLPAAAASSSAEPVVPEVKEGFGLAAVGVRGANPLAVGGSDVSPSEVPGLVHEDYIASPSFVPERSSCASAAASPGASDLSFDRWAQPSPEPDPWDALSVSSIEREGGSPRPGGTSSAVTEAAAAELPSELSDWQCVQTSEQAPSPLASVAAGPQTAERPASVGQIVQQEAARFSDDPANALLMPWETPLMKLLFSDDDATLYASLPAPSFVLKEPPPPLPALPGGSGARDRAAGELLEGNICEHAVRRFKDEDDFDKEEKILLRAAAKWALIVSRYAREVGWAPTSEDEIIACFGTRSVHTVMKRANAFSAFLRWLDVVSSANPSAFCDAAYWKYLKFLESSGAAASSAASFLASVRFCRFVTGLTGTEEPSRRCVGLAEKLAAQADIVRPAEALTVGQLLTIHDTLHDPVTSRWDKAFSAYALVALYGRARHSDLKRVERLEWDLPPSAESNEAGRQGYLIIFTRHHKTSRATARKSRLLPIIIPVLGIHDKPWVFAAKAAFESVGLSLSGEIQGPLFRPPVDFSADQLCNRSITSAEVSVFIRLLLGLGHDAPAVGPRVTSHSLKRTCLAWASKAGFDRLTRSCLGRHAYATEGTEAIYSVELGLPHVQKLETLLRFILKGTFAPDASRALMWAFPPPTAEVSSVAAPEPGFASQPEALQSEPLGERDAASGDEGQSVSSTSSSSSSSESGSSGTEASPPGKQPRRAVAEGPRLEAEGGWVVHRRSQILHRVYREKVLLCGRPRTKAYEVVADITRMGNLVCKTCERNAS